MKHLFHYQIPVICTLIGVISVILLINRQSNVATQEVPIYQECPEPQTCEVKTITKYVPTEVIKEVIKEVPVEKIVYQDRIIYQGDQDCRIELVSCKSARQNLFDMYSENIKTLNSYRATTTDFKESYKSLLYQFETLIDLTFGLNRDYLFQPKLVERLNDFVEIASTSHSFLGKYK